MIQSYLTWLCREQAKSICNILILNDRNTKAVKGNTFATAAEATDYISNNKGDAVWATVHELKPTAVGKTKIAKTDVAAYRYLAIDIDSKGAHGGKVCATDAERAKTAATADAITAMLKSYGLPQPLKVMSGNGSLLLFPIDLPYDADNYAMMDAFAKVLADRFNTADCDIDKAVIKDPSRVLGVVGSFNRRMAEAEGRQAMMRVVVGDYPKNEPMAADAITAAVGRIMADYGAAATELPNAFDAADAQTPTTPTASHDGWAAAELNDRQQRCMAYLAKTADAISGEHGHDTTLCAACECRRFDLSVDEALKVMEWFNETKCKPCWTADELRKKLGDAYAKVKDVGSRLDGDKGGDNKGNDDADGLKVGEYPMTDLGNAEHFVSTYGERLRYISAWHSWLIWDGVVWKRDESDRTRRAAMEFVRKVMLDYAKTIKDDDRRTKYLRWTAASQSASRIDAMLSLAATKLACSTDALDANPNLFNVRNGTIELAPLRFRPHDRNDLLTKVGNVSYEPTATAPTWDKFLERIFQDGDGKPRADVVAYVARAVGYSMTADVSAQCLFILHGVGNNGKTTFLGGVKNVMGDYATIGLQSVLLKMDATQSRNSDDEADLMGRRLVIVSETSEGQRIDEAKAKRLVGGGRIRAMRKFEHPFEFEPTHKIWMDCNHLPTIKGNDDGIWRRLKKIPFLVQIPSAERDEHLADKLAAEASGILTWMLRGLSDWLAHGRRLDEPREVMAATADYKGESDVFGAFLADCLVPNDFERTPSHDAYRAYLAWAANNGMTYKMTKLEFGKKMASRGYLSKPFHGVRSFVGCSLRSADADATDSTADGETAATVEDDRPF